MLSILVAAIALQTLALASDINPFAASFAQCKTKDWYPLSCGLNKTTPSVKDDCCSINPGGLVLQTQFWDTDAGLDNAWTVHGLWPDYCDGTYPAYCTPKGSNATITNITEIFKANNAMDLFYEMETYWVSDTSTDASLYIHEYLKHGTCLSTLNQTCYGAGYIAGQEIVDYWRAALRQYHLLPTYQWLEAAGIVPSVNATYLYNDVQTAIRTAFGQNATLSCTKSGQLSEVWYNFNVYGTAQDGAYIPVAPPSNYTSCPTNSTGIKYPVKIAGYKHSPYGFGANNITYFY